MVIHQQTLIGKAMSEDVTTHGSLGIRPGTIPIILGTILIGTGIAGGIHGITHGDMILGIHIIIITTLVMLSEVQYMAVAV